MFSGKDGSTLSPEDFMPYQPRFELTEEEMQRDYDQRLQKAINVMKFYTAQHNASMQQNG